MKPFCYDRALDSAIGNYENLEGENGIPAGTKQGSGAFLGCELGTKARPTGQALGPVREEILKQTRRFRNQAVHLICFFCSLESGSL